MFGERVIGYVVAQHGAHIFADQLKAHCRGQLAAYKVPRNFEVCDKLPTTFLGKLRRVELRAQAATTSITSSRSMESTPSSPEMETCQKP